LEGLQHEHQAADTLEYVLKSGIGGPICQSTYDCLSPFPLYDVRWTHNCGAGNRRGGMDSGASTKLVSERRAHLQCLCRAAQFRSRSGCMWSSTKRERLAGSSRRWCRSQNHIRRSPQCQDWRHCCFQAHCQTAAMSDSPSLSTDQREIYFKSHISLWEHSSHFRLIGRRVPSVSVFSQLMYKFLCLASPKENPQVPM